MKRICSIITIALGISLGLIVSNVNAWSDYYYSADTCLKASGGREGIASVQWACSWANYATEATCALWIGAADDEVDPTIYSDKTSGNVTIRYYRMCWNGEPMGTAAIWVENDNNAIDDSGNMNGGDWGYPLHKDTSLNIDKFTSGITSKRVEVDGIAYNQYQRTVKVWRMSSNARSCDDYNGACSSMDETVTLRLRVRKSFQAKANVSHGTTNTTTDYKVEGGTSQTITCTNTKDGCPVSFSFYLKRVAGSNGDKTTYSIDQKIDPSGSWKDKYTNISFTPSDSGSLVKTYKTNIKPGRSICYRMVYHPYGGFEANVEKTVSACAYAVGSFESSIKIEAKKNNDPYQTSTIYAKPNDVIYFKGTYTPTAQYGSTTLMPSTVKVGSKSNNESSKVIKDRFNTLMGSNPGWNNAFSIAFDKSGFSTRNFSNNPGNIAAYSSSNDTYSKIGSSDPGNTFTAKAITNANKTTKTSPKKTTISYDKGFIATIDTSAINSNSLSVVVPYNFINSTEVNLDEGSPVYAGENMSISYVITTESRRNRKVLDTYATIVRSAKWKLQISTDGGSSWEDYDLKENQTLNQDSKNKSEKPANSTVEIPDDRAGTEICFRSAVYPRTTEDYEDILDLSIIDENKDSNWAFSDHKCFTIAKKPSLQVWGGNIYSSGTINTSVTKKNQHIYGSWGELGIISSGKVTGMASGASYPSELNTNEIFCAVSPLSFANDKCSREETGLLGTLGPFAKLESDKNTITNKLTKTVDISRRNINDLPETIEDSGIILVENEEGNIDITKSIIYKGTYTTLDSMSKVVIYAKNVNIHCNVTRIDALIIAKDTVNTCSDVEDINSGERSIQLVINGAVLTNKLIAGRTYGAATEAYADVPAEIINFDPSLYLWGENDVERDPNSYLVNSYQRELSPRY